MAQIYIENGHEDMIRLRCSEGPQGGSDAERKAAALQTYMDRVKHLCPTEVFGDHNDPQANGGILKELAALSKERQDKSSQVIRSADTPFPGKNATGPDGEGTRDLTKLFEASAPTNIIEDYRGEEMLDSSVLIKAGFGNLTKWSEALKGGLVNETFHPKYHAICFQLRSGRP